ncbi:CRISPR-associated endoribonuclease Cas2 [Rubrobacter xylanophilus]|uniref:CRISPR-associated endoribonuclease Cas2 n=1 Tax=Rubrobacter xylanophilus TaxID=49319 RepID=A0A510HPI1_9ACTN|nr:CRISPR-associated endoribonuclease Cas2 [Rubrobacter xylanophilus]
MYVIMVYDVNVKRVVKVLKIGRKYLEHVQNSVLEGELSPAQYKKLKHEVSKAIDPEEDAVRFYLLRSTRYLSTEELGLPSRPEQETSFL